MKIIIVGAGVVGESLCSELSEVGNDVILVEKEEQRLNKIVETNDVTGYIGNGASYETLLEAGTDTADIFIATTPTDELNIMACIIAKKMGAKYTISRVRNPEYGSNLSFVRDDLGISLIVNPEMESAKNIANKLFFPNALSAESFFWQRANMISLKIEENSFLKDMHLKDLDVDQSEKVIICIVERGNDVFIPSGDFQILKNDVIYVMGPTEAVRKFYKKMGYSRYVNSSMIIGGGTISHYLIDILLREKKQVKVIDSDMQKLEHLSQTFPNVCAIYGDETDHEFLIDEGIKNFDSIVMLSDSDEENMVLSMFARSLTASKIVTKIDRTLLLPIIEDYGVKSTVIPKKVIADIIIRVVRARINTRGSKMKTLHRLCENRVELIIFEIKKESHIVGIPLKDLKLKTSVIIAGIFRNDNLIFPGGNDTIETGDYVMIITTTPIDDFEGIILK